jgi:hypothetical protein
MMDFLHGAKRPNVTGHKLIANLCRAEVRGGFSAPVVNGRDFRLFALVLRRLRERVQFPPISRELPRDGAEVVTKGLRGAVSAASR